MIPPLSAMFNILISNVILKHRELIVNGDARKTLIFLQETSHRKQYIHISETSETLVQDFVRFEQNRNMYSALKSNILCKSE